MNAASAENSAKIFPAPIPIAFIRPISRVRSCTDISSVLMMPKPAAMSAMMAKPLSTQTRPLMTELMAPSWSSSVMPTMSWVRSSRLMRETSSGVLPGRRWTVAPW